MVRCKAGDLLRREAYLLRPKKVTRHDVSANSLPGGEDAGFPPARTRTRTRDDYYVQVIGNVFFSDVGAGLASAQPVSQVMLNLPNHLHGIMMIDHSKHEAAESTPDAHRADARPAPTIGANICSFKSWCIQEKI